MAPSLRTLLLSIAILCLLSGFHITGHAQRFNERIREMVTRADELMATDEDDAAMKLLERLAGFQVTKYERAVIAQMKGSLHLKREEYRQALELYEEAVNLDQLAPSINLQMTYNIAQLHATQSNWEACLKWLERWLGETGEPTRDSFTLGANAAAQLGEDRRALRYTKQAINIAPNPPKELFRLWMALHFKLEEKEGAVEALEAAIVHYPNEAEFWRTLGLLYLNLDRTEQAVATLEIAYDRGWIRERSQLEQIIQLMLFSDLNHKGATILEKHLTAGELPQTAENYDRLSRAWYMARDYDRSLKYLEKAAELSPDPELDLRAAQIFLEKEAFAAAEEHLQAALEKGPGEQLGQALLLLGYSEYGQQAYEEAVEAFEEAAQIPAKRRDALNWLQHLEEEFGAESPLTDGLAMKFALADKLEQMRAAKAPATDPQIAEAMERLEEAQRRITAPEFEVANRLEKAQSTIESALQRLEVKKAAAESAAEEARGQLGQTLAKIQEDLVELRRVLSDLEMPDARRLANDKTSDESRP